MNEETQTEEGYLYEALLDICDDAGEREMRVPLVGFVGIQFFAKLLLDCAPTTEAALELIQEAIADAEDAS